MPTTRDYYEILGVQKNASESDIKQAYRNLAREHHPDMVKDGDKKAAETRFKEINEAYQVLSDAQKRKMYDQYGHAGANFGGGHPGGAGGQQGNWGPFTYSYSTGGQQGNPFGGFGDIDPFDVFEDFFGFRGFGGSRAPKRGKNLHYEMTLSFSDAVKGLEKVIKVESGEITVKIPAGVSDGNEIRFAGKGMPGPNGAPAGDLFLTLRVDTPKIFERSNETLGVLSTIDIVTAILGGEVKVPVVDVNAKDCIGEATLKIPSGTQSGMQFKIKGKGMPQLRGNGRGDVIVQIVVDIPKKVSRRQKELLEEYRRSN